MHNPIICGQVEILPTPENIALISNIIIIIFYFFYLFFYYIGALSDFTGEIGRFAVAKASIRDIDEVRCILQADVAVAGSIMLLNTTGKYTQKANSVMTNMKKVEDIVYELSMLQRGGKIRNKEKEVQPKEEKEGSEKADF